MKKRFSEEQIIGFLREAETGLPVKELCRRHGFSEASCYLWRRKFGGMRVPDAKRLEDLETENSRLKKLLAESLLENEVTRGSTPYFRLVFYRYGRGSIPIATNKCVRNQERAQPDGVACR